MELSQYDIEYIPRTSIKGQALADFVVECTWFIEKQSEKEKRLEPKWQLYVDGASNEYGARAWYVVITPDEHILHYVMKLGSPATNSTSE